MNQTREWLIAREAQLRTDVAGARSHLSNLEAALVDIRIAMRALGLPVLVDRGLVQSMTMKEMTLQALGDYYKQGASSRDLVAYFADAFGKTISRTSLSPQLSRLVREKKIVNVDGKWKLAA